MMRILILVHKDFVPPEKVVKKETDWERVPWTSEYDVAETLKKSGHKVEMLGVESRLYRIREAIERFKPHVVFNLLEEFLGEAIFDQNVVSYLELLRTSYTGCNPRGLILGRDKALSKKILHFHRIKVPGFAVFPRNHRKARPKRLDFPLIVKCLNEEASSGISQASIVDSDEKLQERVAFIHKEYGVDAIAEQLIKGREFYVGVLGNYRLDILPTWELFFKKSEDPAKQIYTRTAKFDPNYRKRHGVKTGAANISDDLAKRLTTISKKAFRVLDLSGYARIDFRVDEQENIYVLEVNPNPEIAKAEDFAKSAEKAGIGYDRLLQKIINLGLRWNPVS